MRRLLSAALLWLGLTSYVLAGSIAVTPGTGTTVGAGSDGTAQIPATILCGATASATLYATCVNQAIVNASGQLLTLATQGGTWTVQPGNTANTTAWLVTGTGGTFPITGSLNANQSVNEAQINGVTPLMGAGVSGTGSQRVNVAQDTTTIAGSAVGTAGAASANVVTVQGIASGTNLPVSLAANQSVNLAQVGGTSTSTNPLMVAVSVAPATATNSALTVDLRPDSPGIIPLGAAAITGSLSTNITSQYPVNATTTTPIPETISATGTTTSFTATLAAAAGKTTFICGFQVDAYATAATTVALTLTGTITGTMNFQESVSVIGSNTGHTGQAFSPCIPASAANTAIVVNAGAAGSGGVATISAWGYQL